jgi:hypothetical protein
MIPMEAGPFKPCGRFASQVYEIRVDKTDKPARFKIGDLLIDRLISTDT